MGQWVVTVAGIAILSVLCDVILPEGQTRKYIKTVVGVIVTLVMLQPIVSFVGRSGKLDIPTSGSYSVEVQQSYLDMVEDKQYKAQAETVKSILQAKDVAVKDVTVNRSSKTVSVSVDEKRSEAKQSQINSVVKTYFADYKITIVWK